MQSTSESKRKPVSLLKVGGLLTVTPQIYLPHCEIKEEREIWRSYKSSLPSHLHTPDQSRSEAGMNAALSGFLKVRQTLGVYEEAKKTKTFCSTKHGQTSRIRQQNESINITYVL